LFAAKIEVAINSHFLTAYTFSSVTPKVVF